MFFNKSRFGDHRESIPINILSINEKNQSINLSTEGKKLSKASEASEDVNSMNYDQINRLRKLISDKDYEKAYNLCVDTINKSVHIDRASWHNTVLDLVSRVPDSFASRPWYKHLGVLKGFALAEVLRLTASTACLTDFLATLAHVDAFIVKSSESQNADFINELKLRLFFYLSVYIQRAAKKKRVKLNLESAVVSSLSRVNNLTFDGIITEDPFSQSTWERFYTISLSLKLQSAILVEKLGEHDCNWREMLKEILHQDNLSQSNKFAFEFLHGENEAVRQKKVPPQSVDKLYKNLLKRRPEDLSTVLWYILSVPCEESETQSDYDLAMPSSRLMLIVETAKHILPDAPLISTNRGTLCQLDVAVFLISLSISYVIRFSTSPESNRIPGKAKPLSWPNQPLCLLSPRLLPSGLQRKCWLELCSRSAANASHFVDQLRFAKSSHETPSRLALRVANAISSLPSTLNSAVPIWEFGLSALAQNTEFTRFNSPALRMRELTTDDAALFPNELNSDWWYGTYVENLVNITAKDQVWFVKGWDWLTSHWLRSESMPRMDVILHHVTRLADTKIVPDISTLLLASKLAKTAVEKNRNSPLINSVVNLTINILNVGLENAKKNPLCDEETMNAVNDVSEAISSLEAIAGVPKASVRESSFTNESNQTMPSGYGAYSSSGQRISNFGGGLGTPSSGVPGRVSGLFAEDASYRSPRVQTNSIANASTVAVVGSPPCHSPDPQTKLMTQMMEQWMPAFMEFSKVMSETSVELAKSRLQNDELSRMLKETRSQLDAVLAERAGSSSSPVKKPESSSPSLEDWKALKDSLNEVTASLKDFRRWLPTAMPPPQVTLPLPPLNYPPPVLPMNTSADSGILNVLENQKNQQMVLSHLLQQQERQLRAGFGTQSPPQGPCLVPPVDLTPGLCPFPPPVQQRMPSSLSTNAQPSPVTSVKTTPLKPSVVPTFTPPPPNTCATSSPPSVLSKLLSESPNVQAASVSKPAAVVSNPSPPSTVATTTSSSPSVAKPFSFLPAGPAVAPPSTKTPPAPIFGSKTTTTTTATSATTTTPASTSAAPTPSLFSFSSLAKSTTSPAPSTNLFGHLSFGAKPTGSPAATGPSLFGASPAKPIESSPSKVADSLSSQAVDEDDKPEAFEPKIDFKPCIEKLPDLVEQKTGEENEKVLFCNRARLFRWDKPAEEGAQGEWKARGVGELKILFNQETNKYRIVMRRDQVMKLCANHYILPGINIKRHPQKEVSCMWNARDFAVMDPDQYDPNGTDELFMVNFKTKDITDEFEKIVKESLEKSTSTKTQTEQKAEEKKPETKPTEAKTETKSSTEKSQPSGIDAFKPKPGSWTCSGCLLVLDGEKVKCPCCNTLKPGATPPPASESKPESKVTFGLPSSTSSAGSSSFNFSSKPATNSTPNPTFSFGSAAPSSASKPPTFSFGSLTTSTTASAGNTGTEKPPSFTFKPNFGTPTSEKKSENASEASKPAGVFGTFTFKMSPVKASEKGETPEEKNKSLEQGGEDDEEVAPSDLSQVTFKPLIDHLPEKIEVVTGEEGEDVLFEARAKLFRFDTAAGGEAAWKERGLGQLKILKNRETNRVRLVMRREQVHKVCCNHWIMPGMTIKPMEGSKAAVTPWVWWAVDFSDEEAGPEGRREMLSVRFKTPEESQSFHDTFVKCAEGSATTSPEKGTQEKTKKADSDKAAATNEDDSDGVEVIENPLSPEQIQRARALMLPDDFFAYELKKSSAKSRSEREKMSQAEEAAEDAMLEAAISRGIPRVPSSASSFDVVKSTESLVITTPPVSPPIPQTETPKPTSIFQKSLTESSSATSTPTGGLFASILNSSSASGGFSALSQNADATPFWLKPKTGAPTWEGAGTTLFSNSLRSGDKGDDAEGSGDENDPDPQFEPLIPLPSLVEAKTGEEGDVCLFLRRCKLYRMVDNQWKERGIGDMKILVRPKKEVPAEYLDSRTELPKDAKLEGGIRYARLLMRREQILKVCANHTITQELPNFKPLAVANYGLCWAAKDFSEEVEGELMTLGLRFKTEQDLNQFKEAVARAREMLKEE